MARRMEKKSARILAFILALIMLGSVFAYMTRGSRAEQRELLNRTEDFRDYFSWVPEGAKYAQYYNLSYASLLGKNDPLAELVSTELQKNLISTLFSRQILELTGGIHQMMILDYGKTIPLYFIDVGEGKVYFAKEGEVKYGNYTVQLRRGEIALVSELSPIVYGYKPLVLETLDAVEGKNESLGKVKEYLMRINGSFAYAFIAYGDHVRDWIKIGNESPTDFFFEGYRFNFENKSYEKVWAMHFEGNYFFGGINESEKSFEFYKVENFEDGLSVAVMEDKNFTNVVNAMPNILTWQITLNPPENES